MIYVSSMAECQQENTRVLLASKSLYEMCHHKQPRVVVVGRRLTKKRNWMLRLPGTFAPAARLQWAQGFPQGGDHQNRRVTSTTAGPTQYGKSIDDSSNGDQRYFLQVSSHFVMTFIDNSCQWFITSPKSRSFIDNGLSHMACFPPIASLILLLYCTEITTAPQSLNVQQRHDLTHRFSQCCRAP